MIKDPDGRCFSWIMQMGPKCGCMYPCERERGGGSFQTEDVNVTMGAEAQ